MKKILVILLFLAARGFSQNLIESVYMHTDKDTYLPGEILWFKMYVLDSQNFKPSTVSQIGHVRILKPDGLEVFRTSVDLVDLKSGSFLIPNTLEDGEYEISAATLLSSSVNQSYSKKIKIINPFVSPAVNNSEVPSENRLILFPEGGSLVKGLESRVGFKIINNEGKGVASEISVIDSNDKVIFKSRSNDLGMGSFLFTPGEMNAKVLAVLLNGERLETVLPTALTEGHVIKAEARSMGYNVSLSATKNAAANLKLLISSNKTVSRNHTLSLGNTGKAEIFISFDDLETGISQITLISETGIPIAERLIFKNPSLKSNLTVALNKEVYDTKQEIKPEIGGLDLEGSFSVAVRKIDEIQTEPYENIVSYLLLSKDVKGFIETPGYYFSKLDDPKIRTDLEYLLLTQGWRKLTFPENAISAESRFHKIKIRYTSKVDYKPLINTDVILNAPGKISAMYTSKTDQEGVAVFLVKNLFGNTQLATFLQSKEPCNIEVLFNYTESNGDLKSYINYSTLSQSLFDEYALKVQTENIFHESERNTTTSIHVDSLAFYGTPERIYKLDDYTRFTLMEEVMREYVKEVSVRKRSGDYSFRILDHKKNSFLIDDPLVLLDGIQIFSPNQLINYNPLKVDKINIVTSQYFLGNEMFGGILDLKTYDGALSEFKLDPAITIFDYSGLQIAREFYSPPKTESNRKPDNRTVLYWNPNLEKSSDIHFLTSEIPGDYVLDIQGINKHGNPESVLKRFKVKKSQ